jgi:hypothetical protein
MNYSQLNIIYKYARRHLIYFLFNLFVCNLFKVGVCNLGYIASND